MKISDLVRFVAIDVPGCPGPVIELAILETAIDFCRKTYAWDEIQDPVPVINGISQYDVDTPTDGEVVAIRAVWGFNRQLLPKTMAEIQRLLPNWQDGRSNQPVYYNAASTSPAFIRLFPIPENADGMLTFRVAYAPKITSTTLDDDLVARYRDGLVSGAKARLMLNVGRAWTNPALAGVHVRAYENAKVEAKLAVMSENSPGTVTAQPKRFM